LSKGLRVAVVGLFGFAAACTSQPVVPDKATTSAPAGAMPSVMPQAAPQGPGVGTSSVANPIPGLVPLDAGRPGWAGIAFVGGGESNKLWILDAKNHKLVNSIDTGGPVIERTDPKRYPNLRDAHAMVFTKDFSEFYTVNSWEYAQSWVIRYDTKTLKEIGRGPGAEGGHHLALSPDDTYIYVGNEYDTKVSVLDAKTMRKLKDLEVGYGPDYISPSMYWDGKVIDTPYLWVSVDKANQVVAIDWRTNEVAKVLPLKGASHGINITPDGKYVWTGDGATKEMVIIDNKTLEVVKTFPTPEGRMVHVVFSPDSKYAYFTAGGRLEKYDTQTLKPIWVSATGGAHLGLTPDGKYVWTLAHTFEQGDRYPYLLAGDPLSSAKVVDAESGQFIAEMPFQYRPHEIQFVPYSALGQPKTAAVAGTAAATAVPSPAATVRSVKLNASYDTFQPDVVTAKSGESLVFEIANQDGYLHDFVTKGDVPGDRIKVDLPPGVATTVTWTAPKASGKYLFECTIHPGQQLTVIVP
jgi:YVTN family beta-propeller protein